MKRRNMIAVHLENGRVAVRQRPLPSRPQGFALIRLMCAGICNTDLELLRGYYHKRVTGYRVPCTNGDTVACHPFDPFETL